MKKTVLVLFGGMSNEHEVSCVSAANVCRRIDRDKYDLKKIGITRDGVWWLYSGSEDKMEDGSWLGDAENLRAAIVSPCTVHHGILVLDREKKTYAVERIDVVFPVLHGKNGEDGTMQGLLALAHIPCVGPDTYASAVCMNKAAAKLIAFTAGVQSTPFIQIKKCERAEAVEAVGEALEYPVFVKPLNGGSSVGITKVKTPDALEESLDLAFEHDGTVIIEQGVVGREIEVAVLGGDDAIASECGEIKAGAEFYDYADKYSNDTAQCIIPAKLKKSVSEKVRAAALTVYKALGCKGLSRVDFFVCGDDVLFNEINTIPGFTPISMYAKLFVHGGIPYAQLVDRLISDELERGENNL